MEDNIMNNIENAVENVTEVMPDVCSKGTGFSGKNALVGAGAAAVVVAATELTKFVVKKVKTKKAHKKVKNEVIETSFEEESEELND